jgi:hypothetical protein
VAAFDLDSDLRGDVAFRLMSGSFITLFRNSAILAETIAWLDGHGALGQYCALPYYRLIPGLSPIYRRNERSG